MDAPVLRQLTWSGSFAAMVAVCQSATKKVLAALLCEVQGEDEVHTRELFDSCLLQTEEGKANWSHQAMNPGNLARRQSQQQSCHYKINTYKRAIFGEISWEELHAKLSTKQWCPGKRLKPRELSSENSRIQQDLSFGR